VQVSPADNTSTSVTQVATLNGATVKANFAPGTYVKNEYTILTAGTIDGRFGSLVPINLSPLFKATLSYDAEHKNVFLDLDADANAAAGLNTNQRNVFNAIANSRNLMGGTPGAFMTATQAPASLTQISGGRHPAGDLRRHEPVHGRDARSDRRRAQRGTHQGRLCRDAGQGAAAGRRSFQCALGRLGRGFWRIAEHQRRRRARL
jgi:hypothetical protein